MKISTMFLVLEKSPLRNLLLCMVFTSSMLPTIASAEGSLIDLGTGDQTVWSLARAVSADGSIIVGEAGITGGFHHAVIWRNHQGTYKQESLTTENSSAYDISADGRTAVGYINQLASKGWGEAFLWTAEKGLQKIGKNNSSASSVSADGQVLAGTLSESGSVFRILFTGDFSRLSLDRGFFRKTDGKVKSIGSLNGGKNSHVDDISADGRIIVGNANDGKANNEMRAIRFTEDEGILNLGTLNGGNHSYAQSVSADGNVIVGGATDGATGGKYQRAFRWTKETGMQEINMLVGAKQASATQISGNGQVIIGDVSFNDAYHLGEAFRWTQEGGMQLVEKWLAENNVVMPSGLKIKSVTALNIDGSLIVGQLTNNHAFVAWVQIK